MGPPQAEYGLRARVHKDQAELVERINDAIDRVRKSGQLNIAMAEGMRGSGSRN